jgi:hypothetical protein
MTEEVVGLIISHLHVTFGITTPIIYNSIYFSNPIRVAIAKQTEKSEKNKAIKR